MYIFLQNLFTMNILDLIFLSHNVLQFPQLTPRGSFCCIWLVVYCVVKNLGLILNYDKIGC